jgi:serine/threonine protein kinase
MSACSSRERLVQFVRGEVDGPEHETILNHLDECADCRRVLEEETNGSAPGVSAVSTAEDDAWAARLLGSVRERKAARAVPHGEDDVRGGISWFGSLAAAAPSENTVAATPSRHSDAAWPTIPGFRIIREVGRGGMGVVFEAEDERLSRRVALKVVSSGGILDPTRDLRFEREAKAAARLHHTNIVPVFGFGREAGLSYYVMQFIEGLGLNDVLVEVRRARDSRLGQFAAPVDVARNKATLIDPTAAAEIARSIWISGATRANSIAADAPDTDEASGPTIVAPVPQAKAPAARNEVAVKTLPDSSELATSSSDERGFYRGVARIGLQVAEALAYAHGHGILHRDIKPSNLLLDKSANVWVADFGLAKTADADELTHTGDVVGTVRYMAAERFEGRCDARSDVYGLGLTLYELAALRPAYDAADRYALIASVRSGEPPRLRTLAPRVPRDLETMIHKSAAHEPSRRYATAAALADDLRRFIEDRPILARRAGALELTIRWCRRNPWVAALLVVATIGAIASTWQALRATAAERTATHAEALTRKEWARAETERGRAEAERNRAEKSRDRAVSALRVMFEADSGGQIEEMRPYRQALLTAGLRESRSLVRELKGDPRAESQLVSALEELAMVQREAGDRDATLEPLRQAVALAEELHKRDPSSIADRAALAVALHYLAVTEPDDATRNAAARRSTEIFEALCREHPQGERLDWLYSIAMNHYNFGHVEWSNNRNSQALESFHAAEAACQRLYDIGDRRASTARLHGKIELYLRRALTNAGRADEALVRGRKAIEILVRIVGDHPNSFDDEWQLYLAHEELGNTGVAYGKWNLGIEEFKKSRDIVLAMAAHHRDLVSRMATIQRSLAQADFNLREAYDSDPVRYAPERKQLAREAYTICDKLSLVQPLHGNLKIIYAQESFEIEDYQEEETGERDVDLLLKSEQAWVSLVNEGSTYESTHTSLIIVRRRLAELAEGRGQHHEAARWLLKAREAAGANPDVFYEVAKEYAKRTLAIGVLPTRLTATQLQSRRQRFLDESIATLREAVAAGFKDAKSLRAAPELAPIRQTPQYESILADLEFPSRGFSAP